MEGDRDESLLPHRTPTKFQQEQPSEFDIARHEAYRAGFAIGKQIGAIHALQWALKLEETPNEVLDILTAETRIAIASDLRSHFDSTRIRSKDRSTLIAKETEENPRQS